jgi:hypothetical protein
MKISYSITVCNEFMEIQRLLHFLLRHKRIQDNIVILYDEANGEPEIENFLRSHCINNEYSWHKAKFDKDFASWKNKLNRLCSGDYIVNIDADEMPTAEFMEYIPTIIETNNVDVIAIPRDNQVNGITENHVKQWNWHVDSKNRINWPDWQMRVYRNDPKIQWDGKVHERLIGYLTLASLPADSDTSLYFHHDKTIQRQEKQNQLYNLL